MSGEPAEGVAPPIALAGDGEPQTVRMPASAELPPTERLPETEGPPEIHRFLSPPPPAARASEIPPPSSGGGTTRRRSRRTVKVPTDGAAQAMPAAPVTPVRDGGDPHTPAPESPKPPAEAEAAPALKAEAPKLSEIPRPAVPPPPPVPVQRNAPTLPAVPRPAPKASPSQPAPDGAARAQAPPPPPPPPAEASPAVAAAAPPATPTPPAQPEEVFEVIRPMRIISIDASPPSAASSPPAAEAADGAGRDGRDSVRHDTRPDRPPRSSGAPPSPPAEADGSPRRASRPPLLASPELEAVAAPPPPPVPKPPKPPAVEEVDAIEEVEEPATLVSPDLPEGQPAAEATPRAARTDEIEPIPLDEVEDRISDFDVAVTGEMAAVEVPVDLDEEEPKPKKPPPPPPKRTTSGEIPAVVSLASPPPPPVRAVPADAPSSAPQPVSAPPPPPPSVTPAAPPPPVVTTAPQAPPAAPAATPPSVQTIDLSGKKRQKPWWEEIFGDDFIRTLEKVEPKVVRKECDFIEDRLGLEKGAIMLDLACGAGAHAVELASRGYNVVGYDLSLAMLARAQDEAQERGQKINFLQGDMREMAFEEAFDGMYSWSTSFGYFDDEKNVNVLSRVHRGLRQGGMFLLDVINRDYVCPRQPSLVWFEGDGCVCMDEMHVDFFTSRLRVKRTVMFEDGRARECDYAIRLYGLHEIGKMLHDTGFKVVEVTGHPAHPGVFFGSESPRIIVLAERG